MRLYSFTNFYLSSIQQGIQPAHCIADMFVKYRNDSPATDVLYEWATNHKTMICLNGGNAAGIRDILAQLDVIGRALSLPYGYFREDGQSLDNTMTCCGIVVTEPLYTIASDVRARRGTITTAPSPWDAIGISLVYQSSDGDVVIPMTEAERSLVQLLNSAGLAS